MKPLRVSRTTVLNNPHIHPHHLNLPMYKVSHLFLFTPFSSCT
jgi:hypothetical protein